MIRQNLIKILCHMAIALFITSCQGKKTSHALSMQTSELTKFQKEAKRRGFNVDPSIIAPTFYLASEQDNPTSKNLIKLIISTGVGLSSCNNIDRLAITDAGRRPPKNFEIECEVPIEQIVNYQLKDKREGKRSLHLWAKSVTGEIGLIPFEIKLVIDRTKPSLSFDGVPYHKNELEVTDNYITITGECERHSKLKILKPQQLKFISTDCKNGRWSLEKWEMTKPTHELQIEVKDLAGNSFIKSLTIINQATGDSLQ